MVLAVMLVVVLMALTDPTTMFSFPILLKKDVVASNFSFGGEVYLTMLCRRPN